MHDLLHRIHITSTFNITRMEVDGPGRWKFAYAEDTPFVGVRVGVVRKEIANNRHCKLTNTLKY